MENRKNYIEVECCDELQRLLSQEKMLRHCAFQSVDFTRVADAEQRALYATLIERTVRAETIARDARRNAGQKTSEQDALIASLEALKETI